ncbi:alpha/beta hydrolase [uncultured Pontibacter sp.]|uniref:RBBP9/YdeN family alpha/beta hydrolase n=1 Tax=uncultured Pontibacter sp. TaxID=453356 RepID=UPI00263666CF|nr:alpha/beta hydrolase [uncultured Pontibacter sp.]
MFFTVPGLHNSGEDHWQTIWEKTYPQHFRRLQQQRWDTPDKDTWVTAMEKQLNAYPNEEIVLMGHSVGCAAIAHWVAAYGKQIKGALLVAPSDVDRPNYPSYITGFAPMPLQPLPFKTIVVASTNDHVVDLDRAAHFASCWKSSLHVLENAGHIEGKYGYGTWPEGLALLQQLDPEFIL